MSANSLMIPVKDTPKTARMIAQKLIPHWSKQTLSIVPFVQTGSIKTTCKKVWEYCHSNYRYCQDPVGFELIRSPKQSRIEHATGIDCEDYAIIIASLLLNMNYYPILRIVDFGNGWQHIYVVCQGIVIDPVNEKFNAEERFVRKMDFNIQASSPKGMSGLNKNIEILDSDFKDWLVLQVEKERNVIETFIKRHPKPNWSNRPLNYKIHPQENDALESTLLLVNQTLRSLKLNGGLTEKMKAELFEDRLSGYHTFKENYKHFLKENLSNGSRTIRNDEFVIDMQIRLEKREKLDRRTVNKIANQYGISNESAIKELTEYAIVKVCRDITAQNKSYSQIYAALVSFYKSQPNLSLRTSNSILLQQYSTPSPFAYLMGIYCSIDKPNTTLFEPSAGNGLLTIASNDLNQVVVNEIDPLRLANLEKQGFRRVTAMDGSQSFDFDYKQGDFFKGLHFDAVITNPPFGALDAMNRQSFGNYELKDLDHVMAANALQKMKSTGKAAIIIGGHTVWDEHGRIQAGKNRIFLNYLYSHYHVDDIININGDLFSRMGTSFDIRMILIGGRKAQPEGVAPLKYQASARLSKTFEELYDRVFESIKTEAQPKRSSLLQLAQAKLKLANARLTLSLL